MLLIELMHVETILNEVGFKQRFKFKLHMWLFNCHLYKLSKREDISCSIMTENAINRFIEFFDNFLYLAYVTPHYEQPYRLRPCAKTKSIIKFTHTTRFHNKKQH